MISYVGSKVYGSVKQNKNADEGCAACVILWINKYNDILIQTIVKHNKRIQTFYQHKLSPEN